jgi:predicted RNA-binding Zn ribbon-like protein
MNFLFIGGRVCLDFVNTEIVVNGQRRDLLPGFPDLVAWLTQANVLEPPQSREALKHRGESVFRRAMDLRARLREMATGRPTSALDSINALLRQGYGYEQLVRGRSGFARRFHLQLDDPLNLLVPIAEDASDLLCDGDLSLVKKCKCPGCILFFYDTTKSHTRQWCSMALCGNRAKVAAHYRRSHQGTTRVKR